MSNPPSDFVVTSHQFTKKTYRDQYPAIDPSSPQLSQHGKVIIITGASQGLGRRAFAPAFAKAKPKAIVLTSRNANELAAAAQELRNLAPDVKILDVPADVTNENSVKDLFQKVKENFGSADVLVNNAGVFKSFGPLADASPKEWWEDIEINVKGTFNVTQAFLQLIGPDKPATIINLTTGAAVQIFPNVSGYGLSKLVVAQMQQFLAAERPSVTAISLTPGVVKTAMTVEAFEPFAKDTPELTGGAGVWLATEQAKFLNGSYVSANWSVEELVQRKQEIVDGGLLRIGLKGTLGIDQFK
ncbi:MAG: hypothetical protein M1833_006314 [Piccolia ochrophora]|nr:MAG: hypothetical protein M1833_006314 [Piccolia ochrophora]